MNNEATWTWILLGFEFVGITGMWLVGARKWWGWGMVLTSSMPWLAYAIVFHKPGFVAMSCIWIVTHSRNMMRWRNNAEPAADDAVLAASRVAAGQLVAA